MRKIRELLPPGKKFDLEQYMLTFKDLAPYATLIIIPVGLFLYFFPPRLPWSSGDSHIEPLWMPNPSNPNMGPVNYPDKEIPVTPLDQKEKMENEEEGISFDPAWGYELAPIPHLIEEQEDGTKTFR